MVQRHANFQRIRTLLSILVSTTLILQGIRTRKSPATCTFLLNVYSRPQSVQSLLQHYDWSKSLSDFVVLWASPIEPPVFGHFIHPVTVVVPPDASLNWRFYPWREITSRCVVSMDDGKNF